MSRQHRKHVPLRTCIACQRKRPKRGLIRIVRTPDGIVEIDPSGRRSGRGAYLCPDSTCWQAALEQRKLERVLRCHIGADAVIALRTAAVLLLEEAPLTETQRDAGQSDSAVQK